MQLTNLFHGFAYIIYIFSNYAVILRHNTSPDDLEMSKGKDDREVEESSEIKSIGRQITFQEDTKDDKLISITLDSLAEETHAELKQNKLFFKTVTVVARFEDFDTHTSAKSMPVATDSIAKIKDTAKELMKKYINDRRKIRLIGVRVSKFSEKEAQKQLV